MEEIGTFYGKPIDSKMKQEELLAVIRFMAEEIERLRQLELVEEEVERLWKK